MLVGTAEAAPVSALGGFKVGAEVFVPLVELEWQVVEFSGGPH